MNDFLELKFDNELRLDTPQEVIDHIQYGLEPEGKDQPGPIIYHPFFAIDGWEKLLSCKKFYRSQSVNPSYLQKSDKSYLLYIHSRSPLNNDDVLSFLQFIRPYLQEENGKCVAWTNHDIERFFYLEDFMILDKWGDKADWK